MDDAYQIEAEPNTEPPRPSKPARWPRWIIAGNPFYPLSAAGVARWMTGCWGARLVPAGAAVSLGAAPAYYLFDQARSSPAGLIAVIGSFLLFGLGTVAALTRNSWNHSESRIDK